MKFKFIVNPKFGEEPTNIKIETIRNMFSGEDVDIYLTSDRKSTIEEVASSDADAVISVGGDGTLNEVVNGVMRMKKKPIVGAIPFGTSNVFANELGIPWDTKEACERILQGKTRKIDIGVVNDEHYFFMWSSLGIDAKISKLVEKHKDDKKYFRGLIFVYYGLKEILNYYHPPKLSVELDNGYRGTGNFVIVSNGSHYAGKYTLTSDGSIDDGYLHVFIFRNSNPYSIAKHFAGIFLGKHMKFKEMTYKKAKRVEISFSRPVWMHVDSEPMKVFNYSAKVLPGELEFLC